MPDTKLCIEPIPADGSLPDGLLATDGERRQADTFGTAHRRAEYLLWRHIVRRELGADTEIAYSHTGAPAVKNRNLHISVSHNAGFVAVLISPHRCAVDIESLARNFSRVASRYVSPSEAQLSDDPRLLCALWCAKETLYKYSGRNGLDLLNDIAVEKVDFGRQIIVGRLCGGDSTQMKMLQYGDNLIVYIG